MLTSKFKAALIATGFVLALGMSNLASADTVTFGTVDAKLTSVAAGTQTANISFNNTRGSGGSGSMNVYAGNLIWNTVSTSGTPFVQANGSSFSTFCIEYAQNVSFNNTNSFTVRNLADAPRPFGSNPGNPISGMGGENGLGTTRTKDTLIRQLWAQFSGSNNTSIGAAAFQISIWKIIYEDSGVANAFRSATVGNFKVTDNNAPLTTAVASYLGFVIDNPNASLQNGLYALSSVGVQDQLYIDSSRTGSRDAPGVPLPSAALMGGASMVCMFARRARRTA